MPWLRVIKFLYYGTHHTVFLRNFQKFLCGVCVFFGILITNMEEMRAKENVLPGNEKELQKPHVFRVFGFAFLRTIAVTSGIVGTLLVWWLITWVVQKPSCNVSLRTLHGAIETYALGSDETASDNLVRVLREDENDSSIDAVVLDIDSPGGLPVAGEEIAKQLEHMTKPTIAMIRSSGTSAAYWAATGADRIFASANSDIGSIGVIASLADETEKNKQEGIVYTDLTSGKYKDLGSPNHPLSKEERDLFMRDINIIHDNFVAQVSQSRHLSIEKVKILADGSSRLGAQAKEEGLIDEVGGFYEVEAYVENILGKKPIFCKPDLGSLSIPDTGLTF